MGHLAQSNLRHFPNDVQTGYVRHFNGGYGGPAGAYLDISYHPCLSWWLWGAGGMVQMKKTKESQNLRGRGSKIRNDG